MNNVTFIVLFITLISNLYFCNKIYDSVDIEGIKLVLIVSCSFIHFLIFMIVSSFTITDFTI